MIGAAFSSLPHEAPPFGRTFMTRGTAALHPLRFAPRRAAPLDPRSAHSLGCCYPLDLCSQGAGIIGARGSCGAPSATRLPAR